jgi:CRISPR-associated protein Cmr2
MKTFHFTIGPVQGFVAQARKTRDLWAGSYILSYLSGTAMKAVGDAGGEVVFPKIDSDPLYKAIRDSSRIDDPKHSAARIGSLPNRFKAKADNPAIAAKAARDALCAAWLRIANECLTWLATKANIKGPAEIIWNRQVNNLWEVAWAVEDGSEFVLEQRKNIRNHYPPDEPGQKCTICGERQALSGNGETDTSGEVSQWWGKVAESDHVFTRGGKERLCAICTIKRVFPLVSEKAIGIKCATNYPSTAYMSAADWFEVLLRDHTRVHKEWNEFLKALEDANLQEDEKDTLPKVRAWIDEYNVSPGTGKLVSYSGDSFFPDAIRNEKEFELADNDKRRAIIVKLNELTDALGTKPTPFFAVLLMDGDSMGKLLNKHSKSEGEIIAALGEFTGRVRNIVEQDHAGKLVYAGGDDVMALMSSDSALPCANELREAYANAFATCAPEVPNATISAGIVYAQMTTPLRVVMNDARHMLEGVAKKIKDKNAFAVSVWKRGGSVLEFSKKWCDVGHADWAAEACEIKDAFSSGGTFSNGFFYRIRKLLPFITSMEPDDQIKLLTAEYLKSRDDLGLPKEQAPRLAKAEKRVRRLLDFSRGNDGFRHEGPLFIRFLAQKEAR